MNRLNVPYIKSAAIKAILPDLLMSQGAHGIIDKINWSEYPYCPKTQFYILRTESSLYILYDVYEDGIRATNTEPNSCVWEDSCVEFFIQIPGEKIYHNFEFNCIGTVLASKRTNRADPTYFSEEEIKQIKTYPTLAKEPTTSADKTHWQLLVEIPLQLLGLSNDIPLEGKTIHANFYKCGDKTLTPHFLTWNPVETESPDFHRPEYMGELIL